MSLAGGICAPLAVVIQAELEEKFTEDILLKLKTAICPFTNSEICEMTNNLSLYKLFAVLSIF